MKKRLLITEEEKKHILSLYKSYLLTEQSREGFILFTLNDGTKYATYFDNGDPIIYSIYVNPNGLYYFSNKIEFQSKPTKNDPNGITINSSHIKLTDLDKLTLSDIKNPDKLWDFIGYFDLDIFEEYPNKNNPDSKKQGSCVYETANDKFFINGFFNVKKVDNGTYGFLNDDSIKLDIYPISGIKISKEKGYRFEGTFGKDDYKIMDGVFTNKYGCVTNVVNGQFKGRKGKDEIFNCKKEDSQKSEPKPKETKTEPKPEETKPKETKSTTEELFNDAKDEDIYSVCNLKSGKVAIGYNEKTKGMNAGPLVKFVQRLLNEWNDTEKKLSTNLDEDSFFGPKTAEMTIAFQKDKNIRVDGVVGPETYDKFGYDDKCS